MCSLLESIFEMLVYFCMRIDRMLKQALFELASDELCKDVVFMSSSQEFG